MLSSQRYSGPNEQIRLTVHDRLLYDGAVGQPTITTPPAFLT